MGGNIEPSFTKWELKSKFKFGFKICTDLCITIYFCLKLHVGYDKSKTCPVSHENNIIHICCPFLNNHVFRIWGVFLSPF